MKVKGNFNLPIDASWTLFLDRDGVINQLLKGDYVKRIEEFTWLPGAKDAIIKASRIFGRIIVVTNQRGISKGVMTHHDLQLVHDYLVKQLPDNTIDKIYYCPYEDGHPSDCRKPGIGMPLEAKRDFPDIDFSKSVMVGDSLSDIQMGNILEMFTVHVKSGHDYAEVPADLHCENLEDTINTLLQ